MNNLGKLYLVPTTLGDSEPLEVMPYLVKQIVEQTNHFIVENEKSARRFIKRITPNKKQDDLVLYKLDKFAQDIEVRDYLEVCLQGKNIGLLSDAGVPAVADPGSKMVELAHQKGIRVVPLVGPSSILLAMMASGLNGQNFAFVGYLPIDTKDKKVAIKKLERLSKENNQSQLFIETPYRNEKVFTQMLQILTPGTKLCVATDITLDTEYIRTFTVEEWKSIKPDLHKRPTIFIIHKY